MSQYTFDSVPTLRYKRSFFDKSHSVKTSMSLGKLYPIDWQEVIPGDTYKFNIKMLARLTSEFIRPIMDNIFLDVYSFFVPYRVLYDDFSSIFGDNKQNAWAVTEEFFVPMIPAAKKDGGSNLSVEGSVADYLGIPPALGHGAISVLPFRAFAKVYDGYFRDENLIDPMNIQTGEINESENLNSNSWAPGNYTGMLPNVAKFHDYFTSCLPSPQKGNPVNIPVGGGTVPVTFGNAVLLNRVSSGNESSSKTAYGIPVVSTFQQIVSPYNASNSNLPPNAGDIVIGSDGDFPDTQTLVGSFRSPTTTQATIRPVSSLSGDVSYSNNVGSFAPVNLAAVISDSGVDNPYAPTVDLSSIPGATVNDLRLAFQTQKLLEKDARGGTRYVEYLANHFGVRVSDYTLRGMEYLGGRRIPINVIQVAQTTGGDSQTSALAQLGAYSQTMGRTRFAKSFCEHGMILTVACLRQFHSYQQGIEKAWTRSERLDFYDPVFANLGEQPVMKSQLYAGFDENDTDLSTVPFGYQEAWADMRVRHNRISGQMRSSAEETLDVYHLADNYSEAPTLSQSFIEETPTYVDRTITIPSTSQDQFIVDFWFDEKSYSVMPTYSKPGLIDHH